MAIVKLENVSVTRVNSKGFGVKVLESRESKGQTYKQYYTLWFSEFHGLTEGDVVSVSGFLGAKVNEWTNDAGEVKHTVELSVNSPKLDGFPAKSEPEVAAEDWDARTPF